MALTETQIRAARCPVGRLELLMPDGNGLFFVVGSGGATSWRARFTVDGKQTKQSLGDYPRLTLAQARKKCVELKEHVVAQGDASASPTYTLNQIYEEWYEHWSPDKAARTSFYVVRRYDSHVRNVIGNKAASSLKAAHFIDLCLAIEKNERPEVARRVLAICRQILRRGTVRGWIEHSVLGGVKDSDIFKPLKEINFARLPIDEMPAFMKAVSLYEGSTRIRLATRFVAYVFVRTGELQQAAWEQFDLTNALWIIPAGVMKSRRPHIIPLASQVVELLHQLRQANQLKYGADGVAPDRLLFPGDRDARKPISNNTILKVIEAVGYKHRMTGHGFRGVASTALNEIGVRSDVIEAQLAHVQEKVRGAYNHALYLAERRIMMQFWADALDGMRDSGVVPESLRSGALIRAVLTVAAPRDLS